jgi:hypothetical protein
MSSQDTDTISATATSSATSAATTTASSDPSISWGQLFVLEPEVILGFVVVGILLLVILVIVVASFARLRYSNGRLVFLPRPAAARTRANRGGALDLDPPVLWDVWMTAEKLPLEDGAALESHSPQMTGEWNFMASWLAHPSSFCLAVLLFFFQFQPVSAVKTFYEANIVSQETKTVAPVGISFPINPFHFFRRKKPSDVESALPTSPPPPPPPQVQPDAFVDVATVVVMPQPPGDYEGDIHEYCLGIKRVPLVEQ